MIFLFDKNTHRIIAVYSGDSSQVELMREIYPDLNLGEFICQDDKTILLHPTEYVLAFDKDGYPYRWVKKPTIELSLLADSIIVGETATLNISAKEGHPHFPASAAMLLFNNVAHEVGLIDGTAVLEIVGSEPAIIRIRPDPNFYIGNIVCLEVLPP